MSTIHESPFLRRFDALWARLRRVQFGQSLTVWGLAVLAVWIALIAADFWLELSRGARVAGIGVGIGLALAFAWQLWRQYRRGGTRPRTAAEIERSFPQLGQSIRTTVQYGEASTDQIQAAGVRSGLVTALEDETHSRSRGLHLDSIVPARRMWLIAGGLAASVVLLLGTMSLNWEVRVAAARSLLSETPYSQLRVAPGNIKVDQGKPVEIEWTLSGRTDREVKLLTRPAGDPQGVWSQRDFSASQATERGDRFLTFTARIDSVKKPMEYRAAAGNLESPIYRIDVRYPLALKGVKIEVTPPAYTNHPPKTTEDPNLTVVEGSSARFAITLDQPPRTASLVIRDLARRDDEAAPPSTRTVPLEIAGTELTALLPLTGDMKYSIIAETSEGQRLPENSYRVRVRPDQPPEVYFEEPGDELEVHTLAEVLMRIRVRDDFGLARAGIVFEVNNEEEYPLLNEEFATAAEELQKLGKLTPDTQAALEKVLPLEFFELKMTDSVAYYAFAEDNYPGTPHRSVTDLRFVDIRPFRIRYAVRDDPDGDGGGLPGPKIASLGELIKRQRFNLNRSMTVAMRAERKEKIDLGAIDSLVKSEAEIATATRQLADFLGNFMNDDLNDEIQLLLQAEAHMLAAVDSLSAGKYDTAVLQERDALKELIEGRNKLREEIQKNPSKFRGFAAADRRLAQKLRRPKSDKEEAEEVVRRIKQLASAQEEIEAELTGGMQEGGSGEGNGEPKDAADSPVPMPTPMPKDGTDPKAPPPMAEGDKDGAPMEKPSDKGEGDKSEGDKGEANPPKGAGNKDAMGGKEGDAPPRRMSREELRDRQLDNVLEGQDIDKALGKLKNITDLAKGRMTEANKSLEGANSSLDRGDSAGALEQSGQARNVLDELAKQVEALAKAEAAERLNAARELAAEVAEAQKELAAQTPGPNSQQGEGEMKNDKTEKKENPGGGAKAPMPMGSGSKPQEMDDPQGGGAGEKRPDDQKPMPGSGSDPAKDPMENPMAGGGGKMPPMKDREGQGGGTDPEADQEARAEGLAKEAERNAQAGKTVVDILQSILKSTDPADKDVIAKVEAILKENKLDETIGRMEGLPQQLREGQYGDAQVTAADSADRWEAAANRLNTAFREVAAPRLEELMDIERKLQSLQEKLNELQNERDVVEWHVDAGKLLQKMEDMKIAEGLREKLEEMMKEAGWSEDAEHFKVKGEGWIIDRNRERIDVPVGYGMAVRNVVQEVQAHIQELLLGDLLSSKDEVTPPQYSELVERYYEVLAKQKRPETK